MSFSQFTSFARIPFAAICAATMILCGCSSPFGGVRSDLRDRFTSGGPEGPTTAGAFTEGNWIRETEGNVPMGHLENPSAKLVTYKDRFNSDDRSASSNGSENSGVALANAENFANGFAAAKIKNARKTRNDFLDDSRGDGSLWTSDGQTNYFLTKNKVKTNGDILTVTSDDEFVKMVSLELKRTLSNEEKQFEMDYADIQAQKLADAKLKDANGAAAPADRAPASEEEKKAADAKAEALAWEDIDLRKYVEMKPGDPIMAEVVERYPNGNYKIKGTKKVRYRNSLRYVNFVGIAKHGDVTDDDTIPAGKLYEYRLEALR